MTNTFKNNQFMIFCDGGIANRINSLISGLTIANHFDLTYCVYWPENNWCEAAFDDIFTNKISFSNLSLSNFSGKLNECVMLLHDEIASNILGVTFNSAYKYHSLEDFNAQVINQGKDIFFYPAVITDWVPYELIKVTLNELVFNEYIQENVRGFISRELIKPFYGVHLRRTDLNVGLTDTEVINLLKRNPKETFFVCSDDPVAESIATSFPNAYSRKKQSYVRKKNNDNDWISKSMDSDGRVSFGNIKRDKFSIIEGTIDLLILSHSRIIGYSGSTFQKLARILGEVCPIHDLSKPTELDYFSPTEIQRQTQARLLSSELLISLCNKIGTQGDMQEAIALLQNGCAQFEGGDYLDILHTLGIFFLNQNQPKIARLYLSDVVSNDSNRYSSWLHLAYSNFLCSDFEKLKENLIQLRQCNQKASSITDAQLLDYLTQKTQNIF